MADDDLTKAIQAERLESEQALGIQRRGAPFQQAATCLRRAAEKSYRLAPVGSHRRVAREVVYYMVRAARKLKELGPDVAESVRLRPVAGATPVARVASGIVRDGLLELVEDEGSVDQVVEDLARSREQLAVKAGAQFPPPQLPSRSERAQKGEVLLWWAHEPLEALAVAFERMGREAILAASPPVRSPQKAPKESEMRALRSFLWARTQRPELEPEDPGHRFTKELFELARTAPVYQGLRKPRNYESWKAQVRAAERGLKSQRPNPSPGFGHE